MASDMKLRLLAQLRDTGVALATQWWNSVDTALLRTRNKGSDDV